MPETWPSDRKNKNTMVMNVVLLVLGLVALILGGDVLVRGASRLALRFNISPMIVGLTIVAFSTSAPELLVSLKAAFKEAPDFSMGNVVGSNISNISLVLGAACLFGFIPINKTTAARDWVVTLLSSVLLFIFASDNELSSVEGAVLFTCLIIYLVMLIRVTKKEHVQLEFSVDKSKDGQMEMAKDAGYLGLGGALLYFGSDWFVDGAEELAESFGVSQRIIGLTVLAVGTSLPELVTSIIAAKKGETDLAIGNLLGSNIFNVLSILGITALVHPLSVNEDILNSDMWWMIGITIGLLPLMLIRKRLGTPSGIILLSVYVLYIYMILK
ncbi:calcium/sodium antiporter [Roseivirga pacifica]|uniref:calcium/sodium antiporter n=2 Tax=Roseivirga pacifica TaxID=1267423 RepID=UPI0020956939|nr:calcium/sodium antiporter [Roseivirga pacifica]